MNESPSTTAPVLFEYDTGNRFGPASYESVKAFKKAQANGKEYFMYPYHGYEIRMEVRDVPKGG